MVVVFGAGFVVRAGAVVPALNACMNGIETKSARTVIGKPEC